jgi:DNA-binding XRE family transcriptional regulator
MQAAVKTRRISISFKPRTPARVINSIKKQYADYIDDDDELIDYFKTDLHKATATTMTPAKSLRALREMCGWTLAETGKKIGVSPYRVSDFETGQRTISKVMAKKLASVFKTSPAVFI